jgi:hypothetical protein
MKKAGINWVLLGSDISTGGDFGKVKVFSPEWYEAIYTALKPGFRDWLRADFANPSASAHCSLRSTHHMGRPVKDHGAPPPSHGQPPPKPIAEFGLKRRPNSILKSGCSIVRAGVRPAALG